MAAFTDKQIVDTAVATQIQKTGSGLLVDSSTSDDCSAGISQQRQLTCATDAGNTKESLSVHRPNIRFGSAARNNSGVSNVSGRLPAVSPNHTNGTASGPNFGSNFTNTYTFGVAEQVPQVYTKYNRPSPPISVRPNDSEAGYRSGMISTSSPVDFPRGAVSFPSLPNSRNNSLPPSRHGDEARSELFNNGAISGDAYRSLSVARGPRSGPGIGELHASSPEQALQRPFNQLSIKAGMPSFTPRSYGLSGNVQSCTNAFTDRPLSYHEFNGNNSQANVLPVACEPVLPLRHLASAQASHGITNFSANQGVHDYNPNEAYSNARSDSAMLDYDFTRRDSLQSRELELAKSLSSFPNFQSNFGPHYRPTFQEYQMLVANETRTSQIIADQMRGNNSHFAHTNGFNLNALVPYPYLTNHGLVCAPQHGAAAAAGQPSNGQHLRSTILDDFIKNNKASRRYDFRVSSA